MAILRRAAPRFSPALHNPNHPSSSPKQSRNKYFVPCIISSRDREADVVASFEGVRGLNQMSSLPKTLKATDLLLVLISIVMDKSVDDH
jgi:hypothetical protein